MAEDIDISVSFSEHGVTEGTRAVAASTAAMGQAATVAGQRQQQAATQAIAFGQRLAGVANAVQTLVTQFGGQSRTAGLVGAVMNSSVQFAQLGAALGPGGALVGGIIGAAIPALQRLAEAHDEAAQAAERQADEEALLTERGQRMARERQAQVDREVASGHILTLSEEEITRATALAAERRIQAQQQLFTVLGALRRAQEQGQDETSGRFREWTAQAATAREALADINRQIAMLDAETVRRLNTSSTETNDQTTAPSAAARGRGGPRRDEVAELFALTERAQETRALGEAAYQDSLARTSAAIEEQTTLQQAQQETLQAARDKEDAYYAAAAERDQATLERLGEQQDAQLAAQAEHAQRLSQEAQATAANLIGSMTDVVGQIAEGNATAEEGAQMMLAAFLQALSQRAQIEALAQVAMAVSSYPDVAGIAAHIAGALAWGAVAVATGVGGAAISNGVSKAQSARQAAEKPASPRSGGVSEGKGGSTTIVNFNSPVVTSSTEAQLGRQVRRMTEASAQRFRTA